MAEDTIAKEDGYTSAATPVDAKWSAEHQAATFTAYTLLISYVDHRNVVPQPLAGPDYTAVAHIKLQAKCYQVVVTWSATRHGANPVCPDPEPPAGSNFVLLNATVQPSAPNLAPDGLTPVFSISGVYEYSLQIPKTSQGPFLMGAKPFDATPATLYVYSAADFRSTIFPLT